MSELLLMVIFILNSSVNDFVHESSHCVVYDVSEKCTSLNTSFCLTNRCIFSLRWRKAADPHILAALFIYYLSDLVCLLGLNSAHSLIYNIVFCPYRWNMISVWKSQTLTHLHGSSLHFSHLQNPPVAPVRACVQAIPTLPRTPRTQRPSWTSSTSWATPRLRFRPCSSSSAPTQTQIKSSGSWWGSGSVGRPSRGWWPPCQCWCPEGTSRLWAPPCCCPYLHHLHLHLIRPERRAVRMKTLSGRSL